MPALPVSVQTETSLPLSVQLKEQIKWLIALRELAPGDQLPTVQELASGLRINRNTVAQVYVELRQEGYLVARQGQGTFVADSDAVHAAMRKADLSRVLDDALERAAAMGYSPEEFARAAAARASIQAALRARRRAVFVECNWPEIKHHVATLKTELGLEVEGIHLDDIRRDREGFRAKARNADLVVTTLFHAEEAQKAAGPGIEVIAIGATLEVHLLRALAQLPRGTKVAVVCIDYARASRIRRMLINAGVQHVDMEAVGVDEQQKLRQVLKESDVVYVSVAAQPDAKRILHNTPKLRTYQLALDRAGLELIKGRLAESADHSGRKGRTFLAPRPHATRRR
jgi:DNA-binding transcriptional regulator YhcF (GntR family)